MVYLNPWKEIELILKYANYVRKNNYLVKKVFTKICCCFFLTNCGILAFKFRTQATKMIIVIKLRIKLDYLLVFTFTLENKLLLQSRFMAFSKDILWFNLLIYIKFPSQDLLYFYNILFSMALCVWRHI